jgi:hypothetical protein
MRVSSAGGKVRLDGLIALLRQRHKLCGVRGFTIECRGVRRINFVGVDVALLAAPVARAWPLFRCHRAAKHFSAATKHESGCDEIVSTNDRPKSVVVKIAPKGSRDVCVMTAVMQIQREASWCPGR